MHSDLTEYFAVLNKLKEKITLQKVKRFTTAFKLNLIN